MWLLSPICNFSSFNEFYFSTSFTIILLYSYSFSFCLSLFFKIILSILSLLNFLILLILVLILFYLHSEILFSLQNLSFKSSISFLFNCTSNSNSSFILSFYCSNKILFSFNFLLNSFLISNEVNKLSDWFFNFLIFVSYVIS